MLDFICKGYADLIEKDTREKIKNENICLRRVPNQLAFDF